MWSLYPVVLNEILIMRYSLIVIGSEKTTLIARGVLIENGRFTTKYVILSLTVNFRISKVQSFAYRL